MNKSDFLSLGRHEIDNHTNKHVKEFNLHGKCFEKAAACTWRSSNQFSIYPRSQNTNSNPERTSSVPNKILNIRPEVLLFLPILRKLVNESNGTFLTLQKIVETSNNADNSVEFLKISRQYRSIIRVCIESLQEAADVERDALNKSNIHSYITIFYSIECVWHLCEILYIDNIPGDIILPLILDWVRFHFPKHEQNASVFLECCEKGSEENPEYWNTVIGMIVQGRVDVARALLKLHTMADSNEFKMVDNSLKAMPVYNVYSSGVSTGEFAITWKHWQADCRSKINSRCIQSYPELELIMRLITGDYSAFESIRDTYDSWFDLVGGWIMYTNPWAKRHELGAACSACAGMRRCGGECTPMDYLLRPLADGDLHQVLHEIQQMSDSNWFATHLTDLLFHCGKLTVLDKHQTDVTTRLRESLILEYGTLMMEHSSLWPVGVSYLTSCPDGTRRAELMMERIPLTSDSKAMRIIAVAKRHGVNGVAQTICSVLSARHLSTGRIGPALSWAIRARNSIATSKAAHAGLKYYCDNGVLLAQDLLLTVGPNMLLSETLVFLSKYCEFHKLYKSREFKAAGELLVSLITSNITPEYFLKTLLMDSIPLLEKNEVILNGEATCETLRLLETRPHGLSQENASLLRLAAIRNLARSPMGIPSNQISK